MATKTRRPTRLPPASKFDVVNEIGSGGMGKVYHAVEKATGQDVAVKVLNVSLSDQPAVHVRLAREFRAASQLEHPNIVRALEMGNDGETSYVSYEFVEGGSVGDLIDREGPLSEERAVQIIAQIAQALTYAHERKVIHRDVKPDNILLLADGTAKLTDFGLAKDYAAGDQDLTRAASGLGTPIYMAPEQFADAKHVDARSDVYSLGATLYYLVTGTLPFEAKFALAMLTKKQRCEYPPARSLVPGLSERLDAAVRKALDPEPERRPKTCIEFFKLLAPGKPPVGSVVVTPAPIRADAKGPNRRAAARFKLGVGTCCMIDTDIHGDGDSKEMWPLIVQDVSAGGLGAVIARRFEKGTELAVELGRRPGGPPLRFDVRVVRVAKEKAGHWLHGCEFAKELTPEQLKVLVKLA